MWADPWVRVALVLLVAGTIPAWFLAPGERAAEAAGALVIAFALVVLAWRGHAGPIRGLTAVALALAVGDLVAEAVLHTVDGDPPTAVQLVFPAGLVLLVVAASRGERGRGTRAG